MVNFRYEVIFETPHSHTHTHTCPKWGGVGGRVMLKMDNSVLNSAAFSATICQHQNKIIFRNIAILLPGCVVDGQKLDKFMNLERLELGFLAPTNPSLQALRQCVKLKSLVLTSTMGENQFEELFGQSDDDADENGLRNLRALSLKITIRYTQLKDLFRTCLKLESLRLHIFDLSTAPLASTTTTTTTSLPSSLTRRELRQREARRAADNNPFKYLTSPSLKELQLTTRNEINDVKAKSNGNIPREFFRAANQLSSLKRFATNLFENVNGYKEVEIFTSMAVDRTTCLLPTMMSSVALRCKNFTQWRDIRNLLGNGENVTMEIACLLVGVTQINNIPRLLES